MGNGNMMIVATNFVPGTQLVLMTSTNMINWTPVVTNDVPSTGAVTNYIVATSPYRFYLAVQPPPS